MRLFTWTSYGMYMLGGMLTVMLGSVMPELLAHYHASYTMGGFLVLMQAVGFIIGVPATAFFMHRFHHKVVLFLSASLVAIAQVCIGFLPPYIVVALLAVLSGCGASALETAVASYIMELFVGQRAIVMSRLEIAFGLGALGLPFISGLLIAHQSWRGGFFTVGAFALALAIVWLASSFSLVDTAPVEPLDRTTWSPPVFTSTRTKYGVLALFLFLIFVYVGLEGSLNGFLPSIFTTTFHATASLATLSVSVFWGAMVVGRVAIGWVARRLSYEWYLWWSIIGTLLFLLLVASTLSVGGNFGWMVGVGVSMSAIYSITMVYANHTFPGLERLVTSAVTGFAGIGGAVFPFISGFAMDKIHGSKVIWLFVGYTGLLLLTLVTILGWLHWLRRIPVAEEA